MALAVAPAVVLITTDIGQGSGIIYDASGLILTNAHVVGASTTVAVRLASGVRIEGEVVARSPVTRYMTYTLELDEGGAVVGDADLHVLGKAVLQLGESFLHRGDGGEGVGPALQGEVSEADVAEVAKTGRDLGQDQLRGLVDLGPVRAPLRGGGFRMFDFRWEFLEPLAEVAQPPR